ncbi:ABC transporter ATP-binding protein [Halanaerobiaceae bacterium Z-7014]|uniref:ABC transporter ATP-binding protein n=1 Tax=Halonatronomonas betaini TaxID=2778430 RepID=A0A931ATE2_9FIRM|nr:ABC transporter ATP-binding protein [Halonatronomonas betaini]MBF8436284.1 ABC transporter ATP-binding protein [Halonatronomonas betaini]
MTESLLELKNVSLHFPIRAIGRSGEKVRAMDDVNLTINKGEIVALVGESGSGKTTTARAVARIYSPTGGKVIFQGEDIYAPEYKKKIDWYRKQVQMIFQDPFGALNPTHKIRSILSRPFIIHNICPKSEIEEKMVEVLTEVGLEPAEQFLDKFPHELSGGQLQRINIARAISVEPVLLLADEPTSMLDVSIRMTIMNMIKNFRDKDQISYLYITHNLAGARYIADRIAVMYAGMLVEIGPTDEVIQQARHPYTKLLRSAAPQPEKGFREEKMGSTGDIPSLIDPPSGCRFHPRCPYRKPECSQTIPEMNQLNDSHQVRCILYKDGNIPELD